MNFRQAYRKLPLFIRTVGGSRNICQQRLHFTTFFRKVKSTGARASFTGGSSSSNGSSQGKYLLVPGATVATILMFGALHARRLYNDKKLVEAKEKGIELEFKPDVKASFLRFLPLRPISRCWGYFSSLELPVWLRPHVHQSWARAFHSNLEEASLPLEEYASLREFFVRKLKEGSRPIDPDPHSLVCPVDGVVLRFGELKAGAMIEQVKGYSYSASSLLGSKLFLPSTASEATSEPNDTGNVHKETHQKEDTQKSWLTVSMASPKIRDHEPESSTTGLFYCVLYLNPGDYHRIHSPADWSIFIRRHFPGRLFPVNERASRTIRNLYVENERVVLEGQWKGGYMAMAAVGSTNIGSIELFIEPTLHTNQLLHTNPPEEKTYGTESTGVKLRKGDEVAAFNLGSTVILVFQAQMPPHPSGNADLPSEFKFSVKRGDKIHMGQVLGGCH